MRAGARAAVRDQIAIEEPLEIRVAGDPIATTMRTPGDDERLAIGFLFAEGIISGIADVGTVVHCGRPGEEGYGNAIDVLPGPGVALDPERLQTSRRGTLTTASCGVCGRRSIDDLLARVAPVAPATGVTIARLLAAPERLKEAQANFAKTGGVHAAAILDASDTVLGFAEDVGRHNAVDKVVGGWVRSGGGAGEVLVVSGRASFEIIQKAAVARVPIVVAVSAPTSLAVDLAARAGILLAGFVRGDGLVVYAGAGRIAP